MKSKNIKVIDEHSIDRDANIICSIDVDGSDYVIYSIERDSDNDNLFVSKLVKNNDGTSNMMNIEDGMEKSRLSDIVKELITYSIKNDSDKTTGSVVLSNGKEVKISEVLFNKEQNINVGKTYITTVKKAVTKVGENFYSIENVQSVQPITENFFDPVKEEVFMPESVPTPDPVVPETPVDNEAIMESLISQPKEETSTNISELVTPEVEPVIPVAPMEPVVPVVGIPKTVEESPMAESNSETQARTNIIEGPTVILPEVNSAPLSTPTMMSEPVVPENQVTTPVSVSQSQSGMLVFDGSKETNLNEALGEVSNENTIPVDNVAPIREFGQDEPVMTTPGISTEPVNSVTPVTDQSVSSSGFANNKFFMVVAIAFFLAACVFLGYEVFRYFKMVG